MRWLVSKGPFPAAVFRDIRLTLPAPHSVGLWDSTWSGCSSLGEEQSRERQLWYAGPNTINLKLAILIQFTVDSNRGQDENHAVPSHPDER